MPLAFNYCTDEDILIRAGDDYSTLCPNSQVMAQGRDGVFAADAPWVLTSATVDFLLLGVHARQVVWLTQPSANFNPSQYLVVDGVASGAVTLRRPGKPPGAGQPPGLGGVTAVKFAVPTFDPQIDRASFDANREYGIDPDVTEQAPSALHDLRDLQDYCALHVLKRAYALATKSSNSSIDIKHREISDEFEEVRQRLQVRWGPQGETAPASGAFGRITR